MKTLVEILPENLDAEKSNLCCEVSDDSMAYIIKNAEQNTFIGLAAYEFEKNDQPVIEQIKELLHSNDVFNKRFGKTTIIYSNDESVLVPFNLYSSLENGNVLNLVHGDLTDNNFIQSDLVVEKGIYNTYRVSKEVSDLFATAFPGASNVHLYSALIKADYPGSSAWLIFYPTHFVLQLRITNKTELINSYHYSADEDVIYTLLNVCHQFNLQNLPVWISGVIREDSSLYREICKYFKTVHFATLPENYQYSETISQYPAHYFSHLFALGSCE